MFCKYESLLLNITNKKLHFLAKCDSDLIFLSSLWFGCITSQEALSWGDFTDTLQINEAGYILTHTMEYYSALKRKAIHTHVRTWMTLEAMMLTKVSQAHKHKNHRQKGEWLTETGVEDSCWMGTELLFFKMKECEIVDITVWMSLTLLKYTHTHTHG